MRTRPAAAAAAGARLPLGPLSPPVSLSGARGTAPAPDRPGAPGPRARARAWAELLRISALFTVPGDALAGASAAGLRPDRGTALAVGASLCLYEAGMALNDWADREEDAVDRPHRPIPSGRITPVAALTAASALTAAGLTLAARAGRPAFTVATALATTVWAYDLHLKHTRLGPAAMAAARSLDLLLGATATGAATEAATGTGRGTGRAPATATTPTTARPPAVRAALLLGAHTYAVTAVSRHEAQGGSTAAPLAALAATVVLGAAVAGGYGVVVRGHRGSGGSGGSGGVPTVPGRGGSGEHLAPGRLAPGILAPRLLAAAYLRTAAAPLLHAALNPSPPLTQRAVGGGIRAMIPLQAALAARAGAPLTGLAVMGLVPLARKLARKVSPT